MGSECTPVERTSADEYFSYFQNVKTEMVKAATKSDHPVKLFPSHLDHLHMDRYVPIIFAYRLKDNSDHFYNQFIHRLKESLSKVLVSFYPVAGALAKTSDPHHPRMFLCDDRGVPYTEAYKDEPMDHIVKNYEPVGPLSGFEPAGLFFNKQCQETTESGIPCFFVQVTRFKGGGVCVAVNWNHLLADMTGAMLITKAWADTARKGETTIVPQLDRTILSPKNEEKSEPTAPPSFTAEEKAKLEKVLNTKFSLKVLHIKKEKIGKVKQTALQDGFFVSTIDCVCAHLWRCVSRNIAEAGMSDLTIFSTAVEGRAKMGGTLTPHYLGNVIVPAFVRNAPAAEIVNKPLSYAASLIRKSIRDVTQESYWNIINQMDLANPWKTAINRVDYQLGITSWRHFGIYDLDFGEGKPVRFQVNLLPQNCRKGQCIILPSDVGPGSFDVLFFSTPHFIERLWADPEFTSLS
ncbi:hypothetical protein R1flu_004050 [Riccia fluitans]|uniref:Uncharacterized protein n=1 Tax=Riccia fluitans TaxID=41844 RepID=A0ABD1YPQ1_9MARC